MAMSDVELGHSGNFRQKLPFAQEQCTEQQPIDNNHVVFANKPRVLKTSVFNSPSIKEVHDIPTANDSKKSKRRWNIHSFNILRKNTSKPTRSSPEREDDTKEIQDELELLEFSRSTQSLDVTEFLSDEDEPNQSSSDSMSDEDENESVDDKLNNGETYTNPLFSFDSTVEDLNILGPDVVVRFGADSLSNATDVTFVGNGSCLVTDIMQSRILQFDKYGKCNLIYHIDDMIEPWGVDFNKNGTISVTSRKSHCIFQFRRSGEVGTPFGSTYLRCPTGITTDKHGRTIVCDSSLNTAHVFDKNGEAICQLGDPISPIQGFSCPRYVTVSPMDEILVSDSGSHSIKIFDSNGKFINKIGKFGRRDGELKYPYGICTDRLGNVLVADHYNDRVSYFSRSGEFIRHLVTAHDGLKYPQGISLTPDYKLYVTHGGLKAKEVIVYNLKKNTSARVLK